MAHTTVNLSSSLGEMSIRQAPGRRWLQMDTCLLSMPIMFSQLTASGRVGRIKRLWHSKTFPASSYLASVVCIVPVSVNTPGLYDFPGWHSAIGRCDIHKHIPYSLTPTSL